MYLFQSEKLGFRQWQASDLPTFAEMNADAEVLRYFPALLTTEESDALAKRIMETYENNGFTFLLWIDWRKAIL